MNTLPPNISAMPLCWPVPGRRMHSLALPIRARQQMLVVFWDLESAERMDLEN